MLNLLPALLLLLVQGSSDPDARINRAESLILLAVTVQADARAQTDSCVVLQREAQHQTDSEEKASNPPHIAESPAEQAQKLTGIGTCRTTRAGPSA